jgi:hypothetical protein
MFQHEAFYRSPRSREKYMDARGARNDYFHHISIERFKVGINSVLNTTRALFLTSKL